MPHAQVFIVGAGIAGLHAARRLHAAGVAVVVHEARDRVGGRLLGRQVDGDGGGGRLDLGATWFWPGERRVRALVDELGIATFSQHRAGDALFDRPRGAQRIEGNPIDVPSRRFTHSAASLAEGLAALLPENTVQLDTATTAIDATGTRLSLVSGGQSWSADQAILALPPALALATIDVAPEPSPEIALTPVWMGDMTKVVAVYDKPFWRRDGLAGAAISHIGPLREFHDMSGPDGQPAALFAFARGPVAKETARAQLARVYGDDAATPDQLWIQDWSAEPYTAPPGVESLQDYGRFGAPALTRPLFDRLHWASTESATVAPGHIEGALAAAERAADAALARLAA